MQVTNEIKQISGGFVSAKVSTPPPKKKYDERLYKAVSLFKSVCLYDINELLWCFEYFCVQGCYLGDKYRVSSR